MLGALKDALEQAVSGRRLTVVDARGRASTFGAEGPTATVALHDARAEWELLIAPQMQAGELYASGRLTVEDGSIYDVLAAVVESDPSGRALRGAAWIEAARAVLRALSPSIGRGRAGRNARAHYDADERLYRLFLDPDLQYSCAYFETPDEDLASAQRAKQRHVAAKLLVEPRHRVLDIGSGWGGLALYLARIAGAQDVLGVTLSPEQLRVARARAGDVARFELRDYRDVSGAFDRVVSVGMLEHVGRRHWREFFDAVARLLAPDGVALVHSIVSPSGPAEPHPWIERRVFPGHRVPALSELMAAIEPTGLFVTDIELLHGHYERTLRAWRTNLRARWSEAEAYVGPAAARAWEFYLAGCEASFRAGQSAVAQVQLARRREDVPATRAYVDRREAALRAIEAEPTRRDARESPAAA